MLKIRTLGSFESRWGTDRLLLPPTVKSQSLLAYLVVHRRHAHRRDRLIGLFWGDRPERKARQSLSTALWHIRLSPCRRPHPERPAHRTVRSSP